MDTWNMTNAGKGQSLKQYMAVVSFSRITKI